MRLVFKKLLFSAIFVLCHASYHEQYRVPNSCSDKWESYIFNDKEYLIQNLPVTWENAKILCRGDVWNMGMEAKAFVRDLGRRIVENGNDVPSGSYLVQRISLAIQRGNAAVVMGFFCAGGHHNGTLVVMDTKDKAEFFAEALAESQFPVESVWVGARRFSAEDPSGYRWPNGLELRRTALDVLPAEQDETMGKHFPLWLNRTHIPVPESGADCVAFERVYHDKPVFVDLPCNLERPFACEREARTVSLVNELKTVRCRSGLYHVYDGLMDWHQAAAYCVINKMTLANIATMRCLKKLGMTMLKSRPSIETAWVGARGVLGRWTWLDTGTSIFQPAVFNEEPALWPPMRDRTSVKQSGCLQLDRHSDHPPVFLEARCERKMQFICYQSSPALRTSTVTPSDDNYYYVLVRQQLYWQHAYDNCQKMNGTLAVIDNNEILVQLLLVMGENKEEPIGHIWISGRLNTTKDVATETTSYFWYNPTNGKRIVEPKLPVDATFGFYMAPWVDEEYTMDSPCLNLDRPAHLKGLVYGLPCDTPQNSICMIEKTRILPVTTTDNVTEGYITE